MAANAYPYANSGGLLGDLSRDAEPLVSALGGLFGGQSAGRAVAPSTMAAQASFSQSQGDGQSQAQPADPQTDAIAQLIAQSRPSKLQTLLHAWGTGSDFNTARDDLTKRNIASAMLPQQIAMQQQEIAYGYGIQDPALRNLYFTNRPAFDEIMKQRLGPTKVASGETVQGVGASGDQTVNGSVTLKPGEKLTNTAGVPITSAPAAPIVVGPSNSVANGDNGQIVSTAPAKPEVVTTPAGSSSDVVYPRLPGAVPPPPAPSQNPGFNVDQVQRNPGAFFSGVFGKPVTISSGARTPQQNAAVGGVPNSAHLTNQAWDIPNLGMGPQEVAARLKAAGVPFDQVINEGDHTHISLAPSARDMVLAGSNGQYQLLSKGAPQQAQGSGGVQPIRQGSTPHQLVTSEERAAHGISPSDRAGYAVKPDGTVEKTAEDDFGPERQMAYSTSALAFEPLKNYITTRGFLDAAKQSMGQKGGFADLNLIDMAGKSVNPTLAMRPNMIEQFGKERGWPDAVIGHVRSALEHGQALDDQARNALYNTIYTNTQAHYNAAKPLIDKVNRDAAKYHLTPQDLIPNLQEMPSAPAPSYGGNGSQQALAAARQAIQRGAPRAAVIQRLRDNHIDPAGL